MKCRPLLRKSSSLLDSICSPDRAKQKVRTNLENLSEPQIVRAAKNVAPAFFNDPMAAYLMQDASKRLKQLQWFFRLTYSYCHRWGRVVSDPELKSLAGLLPPNETAMTSWRLLKIGFWKAPFVLGMGAFARFGRFSDEAEKIHMELMPDPHWYLLPSEHLLKRKEQGWVPRSSVRP